MSHVTKDGELITKVKEEEEDYYAIKDNYTQPRQHSTSHRTTTTTLKNGRLAIEQVKIKSSSPFKK